MLPEPRPELQHATRVVHGALEVAELERLGIEPESLVDFSVNANPYGPSPRVRDALAGVPLDRYPDRDAVALRRALAAHLDVSPERIVVGNGSVELLWLIALAFVRPGDAILVLEPTFGEYVQAAALMGARIHTWPARPEAHFRLDPEAVAARLQEVRPRLVFLCNPNNPTGTRLPVEAIAAWARQLPQTLVVVDEAYLPFAAGAPSVLTADAANVLVLRSMTKAHALAGLRLGYAVGHPQVIANLALARPPWNVNALAQAAGLAALEDQAHLSRSLERLAEAKRLLVEDLQRLGLAPRPSTTHFFLLEVGHAAALRRALLQYGLMVRDCTSFGLPAYIRIAARRPQDNQRLVTALAEVRQQCVSS